MFSDSHSYHEVINNWNRLAVTKRNSHHYMLLCYIIIVVKWDKMERKVQFPPTMYKVLEKVKSYCKDAEYCNVVPIEGVINHCRIQHGRLK